MIVVTGATGLVGGHLLWHLLQKHDKVRAIRRSSSKLEPLLRIFSFYTASPHVWINKIEWVTADVLDKNSLNEAFQQVHTVYHCAALVSLSGGTNSMDDVNITGTRNVVDVLLQMDNVRLCFVSSIAACAAQTGKSTVDELGLWTDSKTRSTYARSKFYSEQVVWDGIKKGLNAFIVNPGVILGFSGVNSGSSQLFYAVEKGMYVYTNGGSGYVDVRDVVKIMIELNETGVRSERYILVSSNSSNKEILCHMAQSFQKIKPFIGLGKWILMPLALVVEMCSKLMNIQAPFDRSLARTATKRMYYDSSKIKQKLNFQFIPIQQTIDDVCQFMKKTNQ